MKTLKSGWTIDPWNGIYRFSHVKRDIAEAWTKCAGHRLYVVATINWTLADKKTVHLNLYPCVSINDAIARAAAIQIQATEIAEEVFDIRDATPEEEALYWSVFEHYNGQMPEALSESAARDLLKIDVNSSRGTDSRTP